MFNIFLNYNSHLLPFKGVRWLYIFIFLFSCACLQAQPSGFYYLKNEEKELKPMAYEILYHDSSDYKFERNKVFGARLMELLLLPGSFEYPFDSLITLSKLKAPDKSFRIFSWYIIDEDKNHFYYALIQRKVLSSQGKDSLLVIPLHHTQEYTLDIENKVLDNYNWTGALYYKLLQYKAKGRRRDFQTRSWVKEFDTHYVLLGWNGSTIYSNFKMVDVLHFDKEDPARAILGAPLFFFDPMPKYRAVFQYSDNSPFRLNIDKVKRKWPRKDLEMIIFDHLSAPNHVNKLEMYDYGGDGSYDGLYYRKNRGGYFIFVKNVRVRDPRLDKYKPKVLRKQSKNAHKKQKKSGLEMRGNTNK